MRQPADEGSRVGRPVETGMRCQIDIDVDGGFGWRLIAQNGRVVGISTLPYDDYGECRTAFEKLCADQSGVAGGVHHSAEVGSGWVWQLRARDGTRVAASARTYERHSTCRAALDRFRQLLGELDGVGPEFWA
ncbi:hypothetical protein [Streptomyces beijiangensis]|uniref:DUF1508 domain-containing protein n=1 Tax=Streptomyces beijiangensis TaxID=163361 RepID=A0A939FEU2_9ACTN|nr:hypothetical protein [Streptomyces beijiangensis]MBO0516102.1 hypothetical protein [Streptomyces beijiangensis]